MFKELKNFYTLDEKDYEKEAAILKKDITYLVAHYYRTRLNTKFDIIVVLPSLEEDSRNRLLQDMYVKSKVEWLDNLHTVLEILDLTKAIVLDIKNLTTGPRKKTVKNLKSLNDELQEVSEVNLKDYLNDLFNSDAKIIQEVKGIYDSNEKEVK